MTGKAAECAAILCKLPLRTDFFTEIESDLVGRGRLSSERAAWVRSILKQMPLRIGKDELRRRVLANRDWYVEQLMAVQSARRRRGREGRGRRHRSDFLRVARAAV